MAELRDVPAGGLDSFIQDQLLPEKPFHSQVRAAVHTISMFLEKRRFWGAPHPVRVSKVLKGRHSGSDDSWAGHPDAQLLVVFLDEIRTLKAQLNCRGELVEEIWRRLEACRREKELDVELEVQAAGPKDPCALHIVLKSQGHDEPQEQLELEVLPAFDVLGRWNGRRPSPQVYVRFIQESQNLGAEGAFSCCFTELREAFFSQLTPKLKSLVQLVAHWFQKCKEKLQRPLPPQYALELLTVYAWERGRQRKDFVTAEGFRTVLVLVLNYRRIRIYWKRYYNLQNSIVKEYLQAQLRKFRPVILDPADPTGNVAGEDLRAWARLAEEARAWLDCPCFANADGTPVKAWNVQKERCQKATKKRTVWRQDFKGHSVLKPDRLDGTPDSPSVHTLVGRKVAPGSCLVLGDRQPTSNLQTPGRREQATRPPPDGHAYLPKDTRASGTVSHICWQRNKKRRSKRARAIAHTKRHTLPRRCPSLQPEEESRVLH